MQSTYLVRGSSLVYKLMLNLLATETSVADI